MDPSSDISLSAVPPNPHAPVRLHAVPTPLAGAVTDALAPVTVEAAVREAAIWVIDAHPDLAPAGAQVEYTRPPRGATCPPTVDCLPLAPTVGVEDVGHLHRVPGGGRAGGPPDSFVVLAELIAVHTSRDLLDVALVRRDQEVGQLKSALESNRLIGVAVGILVATRGWTTTQALDALKAASQDQNRKLRDLAAEVSYSGAIPDPTR